VALIKSLVIALEALMAMHGSCKPESGVQVFTGAPYFSTLF